MLIFQNNDTLSPEQNITVMAWVNMDKASSGEMAIVSKGNGRQMTFLMNSRLLPGGSYLLAKCMMV